MVGVSLNEVGVDTGISILLGAIYADRLALLCGAGLSMASPSNLPSAAKLAAEAKRKYDALYGTTRPPLSSDIESQAEFFWGRAELGTFYLRTLVDRNAFAGRPNAGHLAIADLLLVRGIQTAVSTNVDTMIETAGMILFGNIGVGIERSEVAALPPTVSPLLKIHGCWSKDQDNTVWARSQLSEKPVASRIEGSREWLSTRLLDRDLVIVGFFTDWDYLNDVLQTTLGDARPARVVVVDPNDSTTLATKAPSLYALGTRAKLNFYHVRQSGADFLDRLRVEFSRGFIRQVLHAGKDDYEDLKGQVVDPAWLEPTSVDSEVLWRIRRDLEGCHPNHPAVERTPEIGPLLGLTLLELQAAGATEDGPYWKHANGLVRVLRTPEQLLHRVKAAFERETPPIIAPDIVIAVGAEDQSLPANIIRGGTPPTIARGSVGKWLTRPDAVRKLGL